jgi:putative acetyltransferase
MTQSAAIRAERPEDLPQIREVNRLAFGQADEADLVDRLRADGDVLASLVAIGTNSGIDGHILFSRLVIAGADGAKIEAAALAPVAIRPDCQRQGLGSALIRAGIEACRARGLGVIVVLGHPAYYPRFGFSAALARPLQAPFSGDAFMALELSPGALGGKAGMVHYAKAFGLGTGEEPA